MSENKLSTQPYKGARDFYPEQMAVRNYIFQVWKDVCKSYGFEEYDGPFLESFDIYAAKSGEELVNEQLYSFIDKGQRKVAIRAEMTPTLARMIAQKYKELPQPIKWFSIANFWRYEKPQRGRLREFFQLNADVFGVEDVTADFEIVSLAIRIMKKLGAKEGMYVIKVNNRRFMDDVLRVMGLDNNQKKLVARALDKKLKVTQQDFCLMLEEDAKLTSGQVKYLNDFLENPMQILEKLRIESKGAGEILKFLELCESFDLSAFVKYDPTIVRGLDYYTGMVFEQYDLDQQNPRSMYGGGRYDDLVQSFIGDRITGTGLGMGDVTMELFLKKWKLLPNLKNEVEYLVTVWPSNDSKFLFKSLVVADKLRLQGKNVICWLDTDTKLEKQLKYADKKGIPQVVIIGDEELQKDTVTIKDLKTGEQVTS